MNEQSGNHKPKKERSPSYPGISIDLALQRVRELYAKEKLYFVNVDMVLSHWGYKATTGTSAITLAALLKFGLLDEDGGRGDKRKVRVSDLARKIIIDEREDTKERDQLILKAALTPKIHRDIYEYYPDGLPSDGNLKYELIENRKFTEKGAKDFIAQFKRTLNFIKDIDPPTPETEDEESEDEESVDGIVKNNLPEEKEKQVSSNSKKVKTIEIPIPTEIWPKLTASFPMSENTWETMMTMLKAMKPALVQEEASKSSEEKNGLAD